MCKINTLENLLQDLFSSVIKKNLLFHDCFVKSCTKARTVDCSSKIKDFRCSKQHHVVFCDLKENSHDSNSSNVTNIIRVDDGTNTLLQTAKVKVKNCKNSSVNLSQVISQLLSVVSYFTTAK